MIFFLVQAKLNDKQVAEQNLASSLVDRFVPERERGRTA
jgi:hypothetical protein